MELISMTCRNCGGKLKVSRDADQIICQNCGTEYLISFNEGAISIRLLSENISKIQSSTDKTAAELALIRIQKEKEEFGPIIANRIMRPLYIWDNSVQSSKLLHPYRMLEFLERRLRNESFGIKISQYKKYLEVCNEIVANYKKLEEQENYYLEIVRTISNDK